MNHSEAIVLLERLVQSIEVALETQERGIVRNRIVARLARVDQLLADRKNYSNLGG